MSELVSIRKPIPGGLDVGCDSCAFRATAETRSEPWNVIRSTICVEGAVPFYCHHGMTDAERQQDDFSRERMATMHVCEGWKAAVRVRSRNDAWRRDRRLKHYLAERCLGALVLWQSTKNKREKAKHEKQWKGLFRMLFRLTGKEVTR